MELKKDTLEVLVLILTVINLAERPMKKLYKLIKKVSRLLMNK